MALARLAAMSTFQALTDEQQMALSRTGRKCLLLLQRKATDCELISYARASYSMARLGLYDEQLFAGLVRQTEEHLDQFTPEGLAALLTGFALLGHKPPATWLSRFCLEVYARFSRFNGNELAAVLYGLSRLGHTPSNAWLERCQEAFRAAMRHSATPPSLAKFILGLAKLGAQPSFNWMGAFLFEARSKIDYMNGRELAAVMWSLALLGHRPDRLYLESWFRCATRHMATCPPASAALALQALAALQLSPLPGRFAQALLDRLEAALRAAAASEAASDEGEGWEEGEQEEGLGSGTDDEEEEVGVLRARGGWRGRGHGWDQGRAPSPLQRQQEPQQQQRQRQEGGAKALVGEELVAVGLSLTALRVRPTEQWMEAYLAACEPWIGTLAAPMLAELAWALGRLQYQPGPRFSAALDEAVERALQPLGAGAGSGSGGAGGAGGAVLQLQHVAVLAWAYSAVRLVAPPALLARLRAAASAQAGGSDAWALGEVLRALAADAAAADGMGGGRPTAGGAPTGGSNSGSVRASSAPGDSVAERRAEPAAEAAGRPGRQLQRPQQASGQPARGGASRGRGRAGVGRGGDTLQAKLRAMVAAPQRE